MTLPRALVACRASQVFLAAAARAYIEIYVLPRWRGAHRDQGSPPRPRGGVVVSVGRAVWSLDAAAPTVVHRCTSVAWEGL